MWRRLRGTAPTGWAIVLSSCRQCELFVTAAVDTALIDAIHASGVARTDEELAIVAPGRVSARSRTLQKAGCTNSSFRVVSRAAASHVSLVSVVCHGALAEDCCGSFYSNTLRFAGGALRPHCTYARQHWTIECCRSRRHRLVISSSVRPPSFTYLGRMH